MEKSKIKFQFNEDNLLKELYDYIVNTYSQHYAKGIQVTEFIISNGETPDFLKGNILKYIVRYGRKNGHDRKDLLKAIHYSFLLLNYHDRHHAATVVEQIVVNPKTKSKPKKKVKKVKSKAKLTVSDFHSENPRTMEARHNDGDESERNINGN